VRRFSAAFALFFLGRWEKQSQSGGKAPHCSEKKGRAMSTSSPAAPFS
jgi:hypothetical protein